MKYRTVQRLMYLIGGMLLAVAQGAGAVAISQVPLFITSSVTPNVMLMVDNSGSMNNVVWADEYDGKVTYDDWSPLVSGNEVWTAQDGNVTLSYLNNSTRRGSCATDWVRGVNAAGTTTKCLRLPDPVGGRASRYAGNYLNYLFSTYAHNTDLRGGQIPSDYRMNVARNVATNLVNNYTSLRLGLSSFNPPGSDPAPGGKINAACGSSQAALLSGISSLAATTWTPLAETLYEITRYFRGMTSYYNTATLASAYTSPIQYRCQKNFVIIITDGFPTNDSGIPLDDPADVADASRSLPNWDGLAPETTADQYPNFPQYSDGFQGGPDSAEGNTLYLDDMAKFAYDIDLRTGGYDDTGVSFDDPAHLQQNLVTYTVGFAAENQMMADAAEHGTGYYYTASNEDQLNAALQAAFSDIIARTSSAASVATNSTRLAADTFIYQARFSSADWGGQLLAYPIAGDGSIGSVAWNAADKIPAPPARSVYTYDPTAAVGSRGRDFLWASLNAAQQALLNKDASGVTDALGSQRLDYIRGDRANEAPSGVGFRTRSSVLGDIINSDPLFVFRQNFGLEALPGAEGGSYKAFRGGSTYTGRRPMVYVAANDGMLHGFDAKTGDEVFAYVPDAAIGRLSQTTDAAFNTSHQLIHDGSPRAMDAYIGGSWRTVLIGSLGGAGKALYALDVTDPDGFGTGKVMWEFSAADDADLGDLVPQATIARLNDGSWAAIVPNGYNSVGQKAVLFVLDLASGAVLAKFDTGVGGDNGLSAPVPVDVDGDRITDYVYAGDMQGNLWKFDLTASSAGSWKIAFGTAGSPEPLWTACSADPCSAANRQPITARPEVGINPPEGFMVYFGTGRYFAVGDNAAGGNVNTFYAIRDRNDKDTVSPLPPAGGRASLVIQEVIYENTSYAFDNLDDEGNVLSTTIEGIRVTTKNPIVDSDNGWYIDLPSSGERQVSTPILRGGKIIFTTVIPSGDACSAGGDSWLMEMDALSGGRLDYTPFDLNRDGEFNSEDFVTIMVDGEEIKVPVSGRRSLEGIIKTPGIITDSKGDREFKYASGSSGGIDQTVENAGTLRGRQSWRQVQ